MCKTVPSNRKALEFETHRWKRFRNAPPNAEERAAFDELMHLFEVWLQQAATSPT